VDLVLTDPPYGVGLEYGSGHDDSPETYWRWFLPILKEMRRISKVVVMTHRQAACKEITDWDWLAIWNKPMSFGHRVGKWLPHWEPIFIFGEPTDFSFDVFNHVTARNNTGHPCPKPLKLIQHILRVFGGNVLDPFMGKRDDASSGAPVGPPRHRHRDLRGLL